MLQDIKRQIDEEAWKLVPFEVRRLVKLAAGPARVIQLLAIDLPDSDSVNVWYNPDSQDTLFCGTEKAAAWTEALSSVPFVGNVVQLQNPIPIGDDGEPWLLVKRALQTQSVFGPFAMIAGHKPGIWPTAPNTLTATLGSSLLWAGLGYGLGWLGEKFLPKEHFEDGKLRRTGAILGGLIGGVPSLWYGIRGGYKQDPIQPIPPPPEPKIAEAHASLVQVLAPEERTCHPWFERAVNKMFKQAANGDGGLEGGGLFVPRIETDQFNRAIWNDPFTPSPLRAATTGLVEAASLSRGGVNIVSPLDIMRIGLGAGASTLSAALVGKTLGALAGLKPETQQQLQRMGTWAGIITNVVPLAFGAR
jgi:hypothetical protein